MQELVYYHFLKCFYNDKFGEKYSTLVNYDWYHPPFAFRYTSQEIEQWFAEESLQIERTDSMETQFYFQARKRSKC